MSPPDIMIVSRKGSTTRPFPKASIISIDSIADPPKPPLSSEVLIPSHPSSANFCQLLSPKPSSELDKDCLVSQSYSFWINWST